MHLWDLTDLLKSSHDGPNTFYCNNSIIHWRDNLFLMTFRRMQYKPHGSHVFHPWKIWDNAYKYLYPDPERLFLRSVTSRVRHGDLKYRQYKSSDMVISLKHPRSTIPADVPEFDSTGICVISVNPDGQWSVKSVAPNLFGKDMGQDARLCHHDGDFFLTYNAFFREGRKTCMMKRRLVVRELPDGDEYLYLFEEEDLPIRHPRRIEKNCLLHGPNILYELRGGRFIVHTPDGILHGPPNPILDDVLHTLKQMNAIISLGAAPIAYGHRHLMTAHIKLPYKPLLDAPPSTVAAFFSKVKWNLIYKHGKFIYYMMLLEFTDQYQVTRISHGFIPTDDQQCHLPYLLCFSTGLTGYGDNKIIMTYGEGDTKCKLLVMDHDTVENLLYTREELHDAFHLQFLNVDAWRKRPRIVHYGYFFEYNCGDDMFMFVLRLLDRKVLPSHSICFRNEYNWRHVRNDDLIVFGGGDVINPYFLKSLTHHPPSQRVLAVSVGTPYVEYLPLVKSFDTIFTRNEVDVHKIEELCRVAKYAPDLGFLLPRWWGRGERGSAQRGKIGISIPRNYYQRDSDDYLKLLECLVTVIRTVHRNLSSDGQPIEIWLIPFCLNPWKHNEDDRVLCDQLSALCPVKTFTPDVGDYVKQIYDKIGEMEFMICGRFHAHIFSICHHTPFVSLSSSRKCRTLMSSFGLQEWCISMPTNTDERPVVFPEDAAKIAHLVEKGYRGAEDMHTQLRQLFQQKIEPECESFVVAYEELLQGRDIEQDDEGQS